MKKCKYCGADLADDAKACSNCGRPVQNAPEAKNAPAEGSDAPDGQSSGNAASVSDSSESSKKPASDDEPEKFPWEGVVSKEMSEQDAAVGQKQAQEANPSSSPENATGYWDRGVWHPMGDLNKQQNQETQDTSRGGQNQNSYGQGQQNSYNQNQSSYGQQDDQNGQYGNGPFGQDPWGQDGPFPFGQDPYGPNGQNPYGQNGSYQNGQNQNPYGQNQNSYGQYQNPYGPNGSYPNGQYQSGPRTNGFAVASFAMGLAALLLNGFLFFIPSILAIGFGIAALLQIRNNPAAFKGKGYAIAGIVLGAVFLVIYIAATAYAMKLMQDPSFRKQFEQMFRQIMQEN